MRPTYIVKIQCYPVLKMLASALVHNIYFYQGIIQLAID